MTIGFDMTQPESLWIVTEYEIETVLDEYDLVTDENIKKGLEMIDQKEVDKAANAHTDARQQMYAAFACIEDILRKNGLIPKKINPVWIAA